MDKTHRDHFVDAGGADHRFGAGRCCDERIDGTCFNALDLPGGCRAIALIRDGDESFVADDTELSEDDHILFALDRDKVDVLTDVFKKADEG